MDHFNSVIYIILEIFVSFFLVYIQANLEDDIVKEALKKVSDINKP